MLAPFFITDNAAVNKAYRLAVADLQANILPFKDGILESEKPVIIAGLGYSTPWTRDSAINTWNAGGIICPEVSLNSLKSVLEENQRQTIWYNCKNYRFDLHNENGKICVRDINIFDENYRDRYYETPAPGDDAMFDALPIIDGYLWRGDGELSGLYFVKRGTDEKVDGKLMSSETVNDTTLKITFELDGEKAVCLCDEEKVRFELASASYDMLFKYKELRNTNIEEIGGSSVKYEHGSMSYGLKLSCKVLGEENGYRISPEGDSFELCFQRFGKK